MTAKISDAPDGTTSFEVDGGRIVLVVDGAAVDADDGEREAGAKKSPGQGLLCSSSKRCRREWSSRGGRVDVCSLETVVTAPASCVRLRGSR